MAKLSAKTSVPDSQLDLTEQVRARAYQLYEERGKIDGHDMDDWLQAESEIQNVHVAKAAA